MNEPRPPIEDQIRRAAAMLHARRATDIVALDVRELVDYMDFLLIATGRGPRQNRAIAEHLIRETKQVDEPPLSRAGVEAGTWICVDFLDYVVHLFDAETRAHYDLELLWAEATKLDLGLPEAPPEDEDPYEDDDDLSYDEGVIPPPESA